jgi:hypothetical protein
MKLLDWAAGEEATPDDREVAEAMAKQDLYADPGGLTQLVDELMGSTTNDAKAGGADANQRRPDGANEEK